MACRCNGILILLSLLICETSGQGQQAVDKIEAQSFGNYWYQGKGEVTRYDLEQSRYGQIHSGDAVLIFVTEDFLLDQQVKHERGQGKNKVSVLHMNYIKKFNTGLYPYSLMTSVFTPVIAEGRSVRSKTGASLKVSCSIQEWCGNRYLQLNRRGHKFEVLNHSYFQAEADQGFKLDLVWLEDEIWTQIRLQPQNLPTGTFSIAPGSQFVQLGHIRLQPEKALASLTGLDDRKRQRYRLEYKSIERVLEIEFETNFPHTIFGWEEKFRRKPTDPWQVTRARRSHSIQLDYWNHHNVDDLFLREKLGLK
jgi:hypothetical protein